jgi:hypothetical protein
VVKLLNDGAAKNFIDGAVDFNDGNVSGARREIKIAGVHQTDEHQPHETYGYEKRESDDCPENIITPSGHGISFYC